MKNNKPKVILVDDHKVFRQGLRILLEQEEIAHVIGEASNGRECIDMLKDTKPDIIFMDIDMPEMNGIEASKMISEMNRGINIIALSMHNDYHHYQSMIKSGVKGFILKSSGIDDIENSIKSIVRGESYFSNEILRSIVANFGQAESKSDLKNLVEGISKRELEVLRLVCQGLSNEDIAEKLFISPSTVKGHRASLLSKTGAKNTATLIMFSIKNGLVEV